MLRMLRFHNERESPATIAAEKGKLSMFKNGTSNVVSSSTNILPAGAAAGVLILLLLPELLLL